MCGFRAVGAESLGFLFFFLTLKKSSWRSIGACGAPSDERKRCRTKPETSESWRLRRLQTTLSVEIHASVTKKMAYRQGVEGLSSTNAKELTIEYFNL